MINNITHVLIGLVRELNISVTSKSIEKELQRHPYSPSMLAISDVLNNFVIPNAAYNIEFDELQAIDQPFIAVFGKKKQEFVLVKHLDKNRAVVFNEHWNNTSLTLAEFEKYYDGWILIAEKGEASGEFQYNSKRRSEVIESMRIPFLLSMALVFMGFSLFNLILHHVFTLQIGLLLLLKVIGVITSIILLLQSIDSNNSVVRRLCGLDDTKNCNVILASKAAKISNELSWSEVGFFYFAGTLLTLIFHSQRTETIQILGIFTLLTLPFTFYSIYYQFKIAKQWCLLCCIVQSLLWLEFFDFYPNLIHSKAWTYSANTVFIIPTLFLPALAWAFIKPYLVNFQQIDFLKQQLHLFKYNADYFNGLLNQEEPVSLVSQEDCIVIGNENASNIITIVSNPYCQPCADVHKAINELLGSGTNIKVQILFSTRGFEGDPTTIVANHFMALGAAGDKKELKEALDVWYEQENKNYESWKLNYPTDNTSHYDKIRRQKEWCSAADISGTPTLFLNGRKLPEVYFVEDLKYFIN